MTLLLATAHAMGTPGGGAGGSGGGGFTSLIPFLLMILIFYFLLIRPQQKKAKQHRQLLGSLKRGDSVITSGGIYGRIADINESVVTLEIADKVRIKVARSFISGLAGSGQESPPPPQKPASS